MPAKPHTRTCAHCGADYLATRTTSRFCSRSCASLARPAVDLPPRPCSACGALWRPKHGSARFCSPSCRDDPRRLHGETPSRQRPCSVCGAEFQARRRVDKYCSLTCQRRGFHAKRIADGRLTVMLDARKGRHRCVQCGNACGGEGGKYCSPSCQAEHEHGPDRGPKPVFTERQKAARRKLRKSARGTSGGRVVWAQGKCRRCGDCFTAVSSGGIPAYCSTACSNRDRKERRRAREAGAKITPGRRYRVFERDNWICQICGDPVNRDSKVPALDAPVIDHKIPLAQGGEHCEDNWQTAHFYCNSVKRDTDLCLTSTAGLGLAA